MKSSDYIFRSGKGLNKKLVVDLSLRKNEPGWMTDLRLKGLEVFQRLPMPTWGANLQDLDVDDIYYYLQPIDQQHNSWEDVPHKIKTTFDALGIPQAEQDFLAGVGAQYESEMVYKKLKKEWEEQGVLFLDMSSGLQQFPQLVKRYFSTVIPAHDNKFAALNTAVFSGGSFVYVPSGVQVTMPLQAYFRINSPSMGQFERTLIIAESGSFVHYVEGCSAPLYRKNALHSAVVELVALQGSKIRYTTIQNWSTNVYNLVTKRGVAYKDATIEWIDGNFGSRVTMKYPAIILKESGAKGQIISIAVAGAGQHQDSGGKIIHLAPDTTSNITAKSISKDGGVSTYRGLLKMTPQALRAKSRVSCDALLMDKQSQSHTFPTIRVFCKDADMGHEASVSRLNDEHIFYLMSRGFSAEKARAMVVNGFIDVFVKELPMEYAVEINRLIALEMEGSIG